MRSCLWGETQGWGQGSRAETLAQGGLRRPTFHWFALLCVPRKTERWGLRHLSYLHQNDLTVPLEMRWYELVCGFQPRYLNHVLDPGSWNAGLLVSEHLQFFRWCPWSKVLFLSQINPRNTFFSFSQHRSASGWSPAWVSNAEERGIIWLGSNTFLLLVWEPVWWDCAVSNEYKK